MGRIASLADLALVAAECENYPALHRWALQEQGLLTLFSGQSQAGSSLLKPAPAVREANSDLAAALSRQNLVFAG